MGYSEGSYMMCMFYVLAVWLVSLGVGHVNSHSIYGYRSCACIRNGNNTLSDNRTIIQSSR